MMYFAPKLNLKIISELVFLRKYSVRTTATRGRCLHLYTAHEACMCRYMGEKRHVLRQFAGQSSSRVCAESCCISIRHHHRWTSSRFKNVIWPLPLISKLLESDLACLCLVAIQALTPATVHSLSISPMFLNGLHSWIISGLWFSLLQVQLFSTQIPMNVLGRNILRTAKVAFCVSLSIFRVWIIH